MSPHPTLIVNDIHSQLNPTQVAEIVAPDSLESIQQTVRRAAQQNRAICIAGGRHAMGGQQFGTEAVLIDTTRLNRVLSFDPTAGLIEVEAGIQWPQLIGYLVETQKETPWPQQWGIAQKQTGADRLSLGGSLAANIHGRGLKMRPIISDVESFTLVDGQGEVHRCSRRENSELFRLVIGGYGLFGLVYSITLRLVPRQKVERVVELITADTLLEAFEQRLEAGFLYGDFQFSTDEQSDDFLRRGVFACYRPVDYAAPLPEAQKELSEDNWTNLFYLSHANKAEAFRQYAGYYLSTSGQIYASDTHQLSTYLDNYHHDLDRRLGTANRASEIITEIYVPRPDLPGFLAEVSEDFRANQVNLIYGTVRLIKPDGESFLAWARQPYACTIFNLHTEHTPEGIEHSAAAFRRLIDMAIRRGGSYFLTYHKYATRAQVEACYPQFPEFLRLKRRYDPDERFQNNWYRHYREMFADQL
ncbi:MAG: FAD-binding oxidoreductase [Anaerolineae bacterium]|nr:FAD-binding oxidoreductase [Anaerolineae bacterium]